MGTQDLSETMHLDGVRRRLILALVILVFPLALIAALSIGSFVKLAHESRQILAVYQTVSGVKHLPVLAQDIRLKLTRDEDVAEENKLFAEELVNVIELYLVLRSIDPDENGRGEIGFDVHSGALKEVLAARGFDIAARAEDLGLANVVMGAQLAAIWEAKSEGAFTLEEILNKIITPASQLMVLAEQNAIDEELPVLTDFLETFSALRPQLLSSTAEVRDLVRQEGLSLGTQPIYFNAALVAASILAKIAIYFLVLEPLVRRIGQAQAKSQEADRRMAHVQKQEALGKLVGGVAHDFNNVLAIVKTNSEIIGSEKTTELARTCNEEILNAAQMGASISRELLTIGRQANLATENVAPETVLEEIDLLLRRVMPANINVQVYRPKDVKTLLVDKALLKTSVLNVALNSQDAMREGGLLLIEASNVDVETQGPPVLSGPLRPGSYVRLSIRDTGKGMSKEVLSQACDPYFTTKDIGEGSGMGLAMVHGFALQSGGALSIESDPREGTIVHIYLPATDASAAAVLPDTPLAAYGSAGKPSVLLVEDDNSVRRAIELLLQRSGFEVMTAFDGDDALAYLEREGVPDILLTDQSMPGSHQGLDLARLVKKRWPDTPTVLMSGYTERIDTEPGIPFLQKPVSQRTLVTAMNNALSQSRAA